MNPDLADTIALLTRTPAALNVLLRDLAESWTHRNEGEHTWSPYEVIGHLIHGEHTDCPRRPIGEVARSVVSWVNECPTPRACSRWAGSSLGTSSLALEAFVNPTSSLGRPAGCFS